MVVRASREELPTHGVGNYLFTVSATPDRQVSNRKFHREKETFAALWMAGLTYPEIADVLSIHYDTAVTWRRKLDLPGRKCGYHRREQRVQQMAEWVSRRTGGAT